ncbi:MAG: hypothetical protein ACUVTB_03640 [Candidatus Bathycorpusculaceae bacterium]
MLGFYENFPQNIHKTAHFTTSISNKRLQQTLIRILQQINTKPFKLEEIADPSIPQCTLIFEFGIAEANAFNFLSSEETNRVLKMVNKKPLQFMDFFCAIRYYKMENERKKPLKFDYYMLRFIFNKNTMETQIFHERGPRYISPDDVVSLIFNKINEAFSRKILKALQPS